MKQILLITLVFTTFISFGQKHQKLVKFRRIKFSYTVRTDSGVEYMDTIKVSAKIRYPKNTYIPRQNIHFFWDIYFKEDDSIKLYIIGLFPEVYQNIFYIKHDSICVGNRDLPRFNVKFSDKKVLIKFYIGDLNLRSGDLLLVYGVVQYHNVNYWGDPYNKVRRFNGNLMSEREAVKEKRRWSKRKKRHADRLNEIFLY